LNFNLLNSNDMKRLVDYTRKYQPEDFMVVLEDFMADDAVDRFTATGSGTFALLADQLNGVAQIDTGAGADQDTSVGFGETNFASGKLPYLKTRVKLGTFNTGITRIGFVKDADEFARFVIDASGNVKVDVDGGTATAISAVDTGEDVVAGTWYELELVWREDGSIVFLVDGEEVYKTDADVAAKASTSEYDLFMGIEDAGANQHTLGVDYVLVSQKR
jgi:hypothetical protein